jgi:hypothetical protein
VTNHFIEVVAATIRNELRCRASTIRASSGRFPKRQLFLALNKARRVFELEVGGPVTSRWSVGNREKLRKTLVLEYLLDYGICRFSIPQAIRQQKAGFRELEPNEKYEILLAVESELGDDSEVVRDLLKLLDVKTRLRCLVFRKRPRVGQRLLERIEWTLSHHAHYNPREPLLLMGLPPTKTQDFAEGVEFTLIRNGRVTEIAR